MRTLALFALAPLFLGGCKEATSVEADSVFLERFNPPPIYTVWWKNLAVCIGKTSSRDSLPAYRISSLGDISWFVAHDNVNPELTNGEVFPCVGDTDGVQSWCVAQSVFPDTVVLAPRVVQDLDHVSHEMTHIWLQDAGSNHENNAFCFCSYNQNLSSYGCWSEYQKVKGEKVNAEGGP